MSRIGKIFISSALFVIGAFVVYRWQSGIQQRGVEMTPQDRLEAASGLCLPETKSFFYFYYYLGLLPVTSSVDPVDYSTQGAQDFVKANGPTLSNDYNRPCAIGRAGDWGKFLLLIPHAIAAGTAGNPSTILATGFIFQLSLIALVAAAFHRRMYLLGVSLVVLLGSYPFQLFEAYFRNNVLSLPISTFVLMMAILLKFMSKDSAVISRSDWLTAGLGGAILGLASVVRGDVLPLAVSVIALFMVSGQGLRRAVGLSAVFLFSLSILTKGFEFYFDLKVKQAHAFIVTSGGRLHHGETLAHHPIWHPIAAGLGDYGTDRGFVWDDRIIFEKALPMINKRYGRSLEAKGYYYVEPGMDEYSWIRPETMPEYIAVVKEMVLSTIRNNPAWYWSILKKRLSRLRFHSSSARIHWLGGPYTIPVSAWFLTPVLAACFLTRSAARLKVLAFCLPTAFLPMFVTTIQGTVNYSIVHLVLTAVAIEAFLVSMGCLAGLISYPRFIKQSLQFKAKVTSLTD